MDRTSENVQTTADPGSPTFSATAQALRRSATVGPGHRRRSKGTEQHRIVVLLATTAPGVMLVRDELAR